MNLEQSKHAYENSPFYARRYQEADIRVDDIHTLDDIRKVPLIGKEDLREAQQDKELPYKLEQELSGILNWALEGCIEWREQGLRTPRKVKATTREYRDELDTIKTFLGECTIKSLGSEVKASDLYDRYKLWCEASGEFVQSQKLLGLRLADRGNIRRRKHNGWYWTGLGLLKDE